MSYAGKIEDLIAERDAAKESMNSALRLVTDLRWALGDDGARMQLELIEHARQLLKNAERYRWHKARNPGALLASAWGASKAACEIGDDPDAATDAAMVEAPALGAA